MTQKAAPAWGQMAGRNLPILYWRHGQPLQNFGDFLTEFFLDRLFLPYGIKAKAFHIIGSCLDDIFFDDPLKEGDINAPKKFEAKRVVFWGCGLRAPAGLSNENRERAEILAVRGPLTRSALRLGESTPLGDPALLLPALHKPAESAKTPALCVPHFNDQRSDAELMSLSGCAMVLRPNIPNRFESLIKFIDCIATSEFVLASSLHAAELAACTGGLMVHPW